MLAIPAVDIREGACVQLLGGSYDAERVRLADPVAVALEWADKGFSRLHVVDLDAATRRGDNRSIVRRILRERRAEVQVGGGLRSTELVESTLDDDARYIVLGTRALTDMDWLSEIANDHPGTIILAADVRNRRVVTDGWSKTLALNVLDLVEEVASLPLASLLITAVHREGSMSGVDLPLMEDVVEASAFPVIAAGGVGGMNDLHALSDRGVAATVIGMALYTGALDPYIAAREFGE